MSDPGELQLFEAIRRGDESAFERIYHLYQERVRIIGWRTSHRADWVDEIVHESWCRAFQVRQTFDPSRPFLVWMAGIVHNVYREHCRKSPRTLGEAGRGEDPEKRVGTTGLRGPSGSDESPAGATDQSTPELVAEAAELLSALNECLARLPEADQRLVRLRFFEQQTLRHIAQVLAIPEATVRERRLPVVLKRLEACLTARGFRLDEIFSAQEGGDMQWTVEVPD